MLGNNYRLLPHMVLFISVLNKEQIGINYQIGGLDRRLPLFFFLAASRLLGLRDCDGPAVHATAELAATSSTHKCI
jgi:hypothetical protein